MYSAHNEGMSVVAARFIRTLKAKIYKKMTANDNKSYLGYLKGHTENSSRKIFVIHSMMKSNDWVQNTKNLDGKNNRKLL